MVRKPKFAELSVFTVRKPVGQREAS